ncbi:MAG: glycosyltransferase family 4 protein [Candidatus Symbiothrix sp.]|nr:glycosyltransferase family 4 protein [Candidatus Symbiothrix sp.]
MISCHHYLLDDRIYKKEALTLVQAGYDVVHIGYGEVFEDYYTEDTIRIIQLKRTKTGKLTLNDLFQAAQKVSADVYHLHDVELCRIALKLKKLPGRPKVIYDAHEPFSDNLKDYWRERSFLKVLMNDIPAVFAEKRILNKIDYLIATEENVASRFRKKNPNTSIIYNYSYFAPDSQLPEEEKEYDAIYCGSISKSKGIFLMLDTLAEAKKQGYNLKLAIVGGFSNPALKASVEEIIQEKNLEENLLFTGNLPLDEVSRYYRKSKTAFCLFPLNRTNQLILPIKLFEYAAFGLPVIGSNFGHINEIIQTNGMGTGVNPHDAKEVAAALIDLVSADKYKEYIPECIHCVNDKYLWENQKANLLQLYEGLLIRKKSKTWQSKLISIHDSKKLIYTKDEDGFTLPDFSHAGYAGGNKEIPDVPVILTIDSLKGDNTEHIQRHIDFLGSLPLNENGFRGALLLNAGVYEVYGTIYIRHHGIVLRGKGDGNDASQNTLILAKGNVPNQRDVIVMGNESGSNWEKMKENTKQAIVTPEVKVGDFSFEIENAQGYQVGEQIMIYHPCSQAWLNALNDNRWTEGLLPIIYNRYIKKIENHRLTIDAPVFYTLNRNVSQSYIYKPDLEGTIHHIGLENIRMDIETAGEEDEKHAWQCVRIQSAENGWMRNCTMLHFGQSGVITNQASRFTIENCKALDPVGRIEGERGYNFNAFVCSQQLLFRNCYARNGRHHYVSNGTSTASGIVFLRCISDGAYNANEAHRKWTTGLLYDNLKEINLRPVTGWRKLVYHSQFVLGLYNRENIGTAQGWGAAHSVCWNCDVDAHYGKIVIQKPPTAQNYAIGCQAKDITGRYKLSSSYTPGYIEGQNQPGLEPESLYEAQLIARK